MTHTAPFDKDYAWAFRRYQFVSFMMLGIVAVALTPGPEKKESIPQVKEPRKLLPAGRQE